MTTNLNAQPPLCDPPDALVNGSFETLTGTCNSTGCNLAAFNDNPDPDQCDVEGWFGGTGSPNVCTTFSPGGSVTVTPADGSWFTYCQMSILGSNCKTESLVQELDLLPGCRYNLSFQHFDYLINAQSIDVHIYLATGFTTLENEFSIGDCPTPDGGWTHLATISNFDEDDWTASGQISFVAGSVNNQLLIWPELNGSNGDSGYWFIDDVAIELCESALTPTFEAVYLTNGTYQFTDLTVGEVEAWCWDFGDGSYSEEQNPQHTYSMDGLNEVCLTISDTSGCKNTACQTIRPVCPSSYDLEITGPVTSLQTLISNNPTIFTSGGISQKTIFLSGTLNVDVSSYTILDCEFAMDAGAQINVNSGKKLIIIKSHFHGCDTMWQGFRAEPISRISMLEAKVEDAQYGVYSYRARVSLKKCWFNRNFIGLYSPPDFTYAFLDAFSGNEFDCNATLKPEFTGWSSMTDLPPHANKSTFAGVWVQNVEGAFMTGIGGSNYIHNLTNGFVVKGSNVDIRNTNFENILNKSHYNGFLQGYAIHASSSVTGYSFRQQGLGVSGQLSFNNCGTAIFTDRLRVEYIQQNNMAGLHTGIRIENAFGKVLVQSNTIEANAFGIMVNHPDPFTNLDIKLNDVEMLNQKARGITLSQAGLPPNGNFALNINNNNVDLFSTLSKGIHLTSVNGATVRSNEVQALGNAANFSGFLLESSWNNNLRCNTSTGLNDEAGIGYYVWDAEKNTWRCNATFDSNDGIQFNMGSFSPDQFIGNFFDGNHYGLRIMPSGNPGHQDHTGNRWSTTSGAFSGAGARHEGTTTFQVQGDQFTVHEDDSGGDSQYYPSISVISPATDNDFFFVDQTGSPNTSCENPTSCPLDEFTDPDPETKRLDSLIASGNYEPGTFGYEKKWLADRYLYRKLMRHPELVDANSVFDTFVVNTAGLEVGLFYSIEESMQSLFVPDSSEAETLTAHFDSISITIDSIARVDSLLALATGQDSLDLLDRRVTFTEVIDSLAGLNAVLLDSILLKRSSGADQLKAINDTITVDSTYGLNERTVNSIFLATLAKGITVFDSTQLAQLEDIAGQCPITGGSAVFRARSLLELAGEYDFDVSACDSVQGRSRTIEENPVTQPAMPFTFIPNPARGSVTGYLPHEINSGKVTLIDNIGRQRRSFDLEGNNIDYFILDIQGLEAGIYYCLVVDDGGNYFTQSLIISK